MNQDFLVELGTEELPPKALKELADSFKNSIEQSLQQAGLAFTTIESFAAPRRLAVRVSQLSTQQPDRVLNVDGPPIKAAFDAAGNPSAAALGFAKKNGVDISEIDRSGEKLRYSKTVKGQLAAELLPEMVQTALANLPIPKRMRWGSSRVEFVRPTRWLVMLLGTEIIPCEILAQKSGRESQGHRFHAPGAITIQSPASYVEDLRAVHVMVDREERRTKILHEVNALAAQANGTAIIPESLLDEVTSLVEWPAPLLCSFEERFLAVPQEALISTMQDNQKYFCLLDAQGKLLPRFITVANILSKNPEYIIAGNEKVVRPRLTDAEFFFNQDKKSRLETRNERLKTVVFQAQLGTVYEKSERISHLSGFIAEKIGSDKTLAARAGLLCKCDLATEMVSEFPELQGIAGFYYATHDGEAADVASALNEQYMPRFAGDNLPQSLTGAAVAIADKIDTLVGIFGINQPPTGSKDPFALRRSAIGLLRIIIEKSLTIDLRDLIAEAVKVYGSKLSHANTAHDVLEFLIGRYRAIYEEQGIKPGVIASVLALNLSQPFDIDQRIKAVAHFSQLAEAEALAAGNKRVANILAKETLPSTAFNAALLQEPAEQALAQRVSDLEARLQPLIAAHDYQPALAALAQCRAEVDAFFESVMVMADDVAVKNNRILLLARLRALFMQIADISLLQS